MVCAQTCALGAYLWFARRRLLWAHTYGLRADVCFGRILMVWAQTYGLGAYLWFARRRLRAKRPVARPIDGPLQWPTHQSAHLFQPPYSFFFLLALVVVDVEIPPMGPFRPTLGCVYIYIYIFFSPRKYLEMSSE